MDEGDPKKRTVGRDGNPTDGPQSAAPDMPIRCVLFALHSRRTLWRNALRRDFSGARPALAIDVGKDGILVTDLATEKPVAEAEQAQVTATPGEHRAYASGYGIVDFTGQRMPVLVIDVPGLPSLNLGCLAPGMPPEKARRNQFYTGTPSWRSPVPAAKRYPAYVATDADWLTLVEEFGLNPQLKR